MSGGKKASSKQVKERGPRLWPAKLGMCSLRVYMGIVFLAIAHYHLVLPGGGLKANIVEFVEGGYTDMVSRGAARAPVVLGVEMTWYSKFLETVMLGGNAPYIFGGAILFFQLILGICLVLGVCTRLLGLLGGLKMLAFMWAKAPDLPFYTTQQSNYILMMVLFTLSLTAAGRIWGLDARLRHRLPEWIS